MTITKPLILLTGANQGIGFATAQHLTNTGKYRLLVAARSQEKAQTTIQKLLSECTSPTPINPNDLTPLVLDVTNDASITAAAHFITHQFGSLDILTNNAGISRPESSPTPLTLRESYRAVFNLNVFGVAVMTQTFLPLIRASTYPDRRIVNITSGLGQIGIALSPTSEYNVKAWDLPIYRSSKTALNMITAVDAVTLREEGVLVVLAAPGYTRTNFTGG
ncbi:NAD(P)-binding protein [Aspergillus sclerotiicarbonarius CBS 121057]|uniref:NAD(P)-binding protein n=1 Tax=Aspergillus sclerotiicarbonarius (strain CBS 121057 / IBT 28362) TaxID=1448318 RepID=A0A319EU25_ASPSB|nr:NAD(P)-binding protein [Aspergillus sclerotiicarbonarius CBS 121057]